MPQSIVKNSYAASAGHHTPGFVSKSPDLGPENASKQITLHVWMQPRNVEALQQLVEEQHDPGSPNYHSWLSPEQFEERFAPTSEDVATVKRFLTTRGLHVSSVGVWNLYIKAQGSIATVQQAFQVKIHRFDVHGKIYRANTSDPVIAGAAGALIARVGGLTDYGFKPHTARPLKPDTGKPYPAIPLSAAPNGAFFSSACFRPAQWVNFSNDGSLPKASYFGNRYGADISSGPPNLPPCGYQPSEIQTAYKLDDVYHAGLTGAGQTIVIVDAYGSPTIEDDTAVFSSFYGLPAANIDIYQPGGAPPTDTGWAAETTLDVEWAHAVAPGANIALVEAYSNSFDDLLIAILYSLYYGLGNIISNSYGAPEAALASPPPFPFASFDTTLLVATILGISVDFSTGDDGDFYLAEGITDVSYPASSPYATAVGGTSLALKSNNKMAFQTGWGNNQTRIADYMDGLGYNPPAVPPLSLGFQGGSGGGASRIYSKPRFQRGLHGKNRMLPDISYLADPYTGVEIICTDSSCFGGSTSDLYVAVIGGTSLACPMFSGMWAIANQRAGHPLGQAARMLYDLSPRAITDVTPESSPVDVSGWIITSGGKKIVESPQQLAGPLGGHVPFFSALYNGTSTRWYVLTFGTDSSLSTKNGWDDVTGLGTPNGLEFVKDVAGRR